MGKYNSSIWKWFCFIIQVVTIAILKMLWLKPRLLQLWVFSSTCSNLKLFQSHMCTESVCSARLPISHPMTSLQPWLWPHDTNCHTMYCWHTLPRMPQLRFNTVMFSAYTETKTFNIFLSFFFTYLPRVI